MGVFEGVRAALAAGPDMVDFQHVEGKVLVTAVAVSFLLSVQGVFDLTPGHLRAVGPRGCASVDGEDAAFDAEDKVGLGHAVAYLVDGIGGDVDTSPLASLLSAAIQVVAQPQKGSRTTSPSLLLALMMRSSKARGF